jgi:iron complex transport system substrate-binding protein
VAALGLLDSLVGVTTYCDYPPEVTELSQVGDFVAPNLEAIAAAEPDLVLATTGVQADVIVQLEELGADVVAIDPQSLDAVFDSIVMVGDVTGTADEADALVAQMQADLDEIEALVSAAEPVTAFLEIAQDPLFTAGPGTLLDDLIVAAGGANVVAEEGYVGYSLEQLVVDDPQVYMATLGSMSDPSDIDGRAGYEELAAVEAGRVFVLEDNLVSRPGPRVVEGVRQIAQALHPDAF